jgi:hypothetical protein
MKKLAYRIDNIIIGTKIELLNYNQLSIYKFGGVFFGNFGTFLFLGGGRIFGFTDIVWILRKFEI